MRAHATLQKSQHVSIAFHTKDVTVYVETRSAHDTHTAFGHACLGALIASMGAVHNKPDVTPAALDTSIDSSSAKLVAFMNAVPELERSSRSHTARSNASSLHTKRCIADQLPTA